MILRRILLLLCFLTGTFFSFAQDSSRLRISILTCAPGGELYATFGHTAIRVIDSTTQRDIIFNYGTFDFSDPDFYTKFIRGKLLYFLSAEDPASFAYSYQMDNRSVWEQELNLSPAQKKALFNALLNNMQGDNRYYQYDFLFDNCTTRVSELLSKTTGFAVPQPLVPKGTTYRNMLHEYLDKGNQPWSKLGIDLLLGSKIDEPVSIASSMFLPDYLMKGLDSSKPLLAKPKTYFLQTPVIEAGNSMYMPTLVMSILLIGIVLLSQWKQQQWSLFFKILDSALFYITGMAGILLLFMWVGTDHKACSNNYNLIWALPTHAIAAFALWKKRKWMHTYFKVSSLLYIIVLASWWFLPQEFNPALFYFVLILLYRSVMQQKWHAHARNI